MALRKVPLPIQFAGGVALQRDPKQVPATQLLNLENGVFTKETTISKRNGYLALSTSIQDGGGNITGARGLAVRDSEKLLFTDKRCFSQRPSADRWADTGEVAASTVTTPPIARTGSYQTQPDVATRNGIRVVAWEDSRGGVWCSVLESETRRILLSQTQLDASSNAKDVRCIAAGDFLHVLWTRADFKAVQIAVINTATPAIAPVVSTLVSDLSATNPSYDASSEQFPTSLPGLIAWALDGGGWRIGYIDPSGVLGSPLTGFPSVASFADAITGAIAISHFVAFGFNLIAVVRISAVAVLSARVIVGTDFSASQNYASLATTGTYTKVTCAWQGSPSQGVAPMLWWAAEITAARTDLCIVQSGSINTATTTANAPTTLRGHCLASRAWRDGGDGSDNGFRNGGGTGDVYALVTHSARFFPYVAALRLSDSSGINSPGNTIVARLMPGEAAGTLMRTTGAGTRAWTTHLPTVTQEGVSGTDQFTRSHAVLVPYRIQLSSQNGDQFSEQGLKLVTLDQQPAYQTVEFGRSLYLASAAPMSYDGDSWHEADFHTAPDFGFDATGAPVSMTTAITIGAAGAIPDGAYLYAWWYEAVDAQGELHRGAVSVKMLVTMTGGPKKFSMAIPTCRLTKFSNVRVCAARSEVGATGTDSTIPLYRVTSNDVTITTGDNRYVNNDPTVDTVTLVDNLTDAQLIQREPLYTNGGILSNAPAPWSGTVIAAGKGRIFWTDSTDLGIVRYSQLGVDDVALEAPVDLSIPVDEDVTAIAVMDDTVIPFSRDKTFIFGGPGPLADPAVAPESNVFTPVALVTSDAGCIAPASIGDTPLGITFQSSKGIRLLTRQRTVADIGDPVFPLASQHFTRTTLLPDRQSIVYLTDTDDGISLLWDYDRNQWSKFTNHTGLDAIVVDGVYHYLRTDSRVFQETVGEYADDNERIPLRIETAWIRFNRYLQGWQKVLYAYFLGTYVSAHTLRVSYRIDFNDGYAVPIDSDVNSNYNPSLYGAGPYGAGPYGGIGSDGTRYQRRLHLNKRCQAMSFLIEDVEATGAFGASFELSELLLIGGVLGPDFKIGAARSA